MGRLARSGRHFRNRPGRRPQHMTPYKRVIYPVDGFFFRMWIFYHVKHENGFTGRLARSEWHYRNNRGGRRCISARVGAPFAP